MWIPGRSYPGGPVAYFNSEYVYTSYAKIGNASQNIAILMSDAFLVSSAISEILMSVY
jgi:hypothetical protein